MPKVRECLDALDNLADGFAWFDRNDAVREDDASAYACEVDDLRAVVRALRKAVRPQARV